MLVQGLRPLAPGKTIVLDLSSYTTVVVGSSLTGLASWILSQRAFRREDKARVLAAKVSAADDLTHRFKVLMDGYEARIRDLTLEVTRLRVEVAELREELSERDRRNHDGTD
jgi:hypothetical protein